MDKTRKSNKVLTVTWYVCGVILALMFLFPIIYMIATSTKSEASYAESAGSMMMFLPDFNNLGTMFDNYKRVFTEYDIWKYALNSFIYAAVVIVLNVIVNGLAGYVEAAKLDGCTKPGVFFKIILPLSKPIVATVAVFCFIGVWNDYLWPAMILPSAGEDKWPLLPIQAALITIQSIEGITTGEIMASLVVTSIPIFVVYVVAQKYIVQGFGSAGLKM